jgi:hypothetical protein
LAVIGSHDSVVAPQQALDPEAGAQHAPASPLTTRSAALPYLSLTVACSFARSVMFCSLIEFS